MSDCFDHEGDAYASMDTDIFEHQGPCGYFAKPFFCRRCFKPGLTWARNSNGNWQPHHGGVPHSCTAAAIHDFEDLS